MSQERPRVFFFRSLDTAGNDFIRVGPFRLGSFSKHFERVFKTSELDFVPVLGMGGGPLLEQAENAKRFLERDPIFQSTKRHVHFFGHSAGGLVAKIIATDPHFQKNLRSLITIGTPHRGSLAARWAATLPTSSPRFTALCKALQYDVAAKRATFESFQSICEQEFQFPEEILTGSVICAPPRKKWSFIYRFVHGLSLMGEFNEPSDGLIEKSSQYFGDHHWEFDLDHLQQIGIGGQKKEFRRLCHHLEKIWSEHSQIPSFKEPEGRRREEHIDDAAT